MKKITFLLGFILVFSTSCVDSDKNLSMPPEQRVAACVSSQDFTVPVKEGYTTYVTYLGDTLAVANEAMVIRLPKESLVSTRASKGVQVDFGDKNDGTTYAREWQAVMFEDSQDGDYDYNDFIFHVYNKAGYTYQNINKYIQTIEIQAIALGGGKTIKLGCVLSDQSEHIISEDVRQDPKFFNGRRGFINTLNTEEPVECKLYKQIEGYVLSDNKTLGHPAWIAWFIEIDGKRMYAVSTDIDFKEYAMLNKENMPFGIVTISNNGTFSYPSERNSIFNVYPDFKKWTNGEASVIGQYTDKSLLYKYSRKELNEKRFSIWDYSRGE